MGEHPAARMLAAAVLLREQAKAAAAAIGDAAPSGASSPWAAVNDTQWVKFPEPRLVPGAPYPFGDGGTELADGRYEPTWQAFVTHEVRVHDHEEEWGEAAFIAGPMPEPLATYIATMHPLVGLALAGLLDRAAKEARLYLTCDITEGDPEWFCGMCDGMLNRDCHLDPVLNIVRLCLGEEQENNPR